MAYGVRKEDERLDYDELARLAREHRQADHRRRERLSSRVRLRACARWPEIGSLMMTDMAHIAGLVAAGVPFAGAALGFRHHHHTQDVARTACGDGPLPPGACAKDLDRAVFPGVQGGPLVHVIAAKAVCLKEAAAPAFASSTTDRR